MNTEEKIAAEKFPVTFYRYSAVKAWRATTRSLNTSFTEQHSSKQHSMERDKSHNSTVEKAEAPASVRCPDSVSLIVLEVQLSFIK